MINSIQYTAASIYRLTKNFGKSKSIITGISNVAVGSLATFLQPNNLLLIILLSIFIICLCLCIYQLLHRRKKEAIEREVPLKDIPAPPASMDAWAKEGTPVATLGLLVTFLVFLVNIIFFREDSVTEARKKIAELGLTWSGKDFLENVKTGDNKIVALFIKGQMDVTTATSEGRTFPVMIAQNNNNPEEILATVSKSGFDINHVFNQPAGIANDKKMTILSRAIEEGNSKLVNALIDNKADLDKEFETFGSFGLSIPSFSLLASIYWEKPDITEQLLKAGADISKQEYAAYRLAYKNKNKYYWKSNPEKIQSILERIAPPAALQKKINTMLRIEEIDLEVDVAAKKSIMTFSDPYQRDQQEKIIRDLQSEQKELKELLKTL